MRLDSHRILDLVEHLNILSSPLPLDLELRLKAFHLLIKCLTLKSKIQGIKLSHSLWRWGQILLLLASVSLNHVLGQGLGVLWGVHLDRVQGALGDLGV
jgi:hypothetical protein